MTEIKLKKTTSHAFRKDVYLLGATEDGEYFWLEAPSWDCGWYWGFGYIEHYTNNKNPHLAKDIDHHTHINVKFKTDKGIDLNNGFLVETTYTKAEGVELSALFESFYKLREIAMGKKTNRTKEINEVLIPNITKQIIKILSE